MCGGFEPLGMIPERGKSFLIIWSSPKWHFFLCIFALINVQYCVIGDWSISMFLSMHVLYVQNMKLTNI